MRAVYVQNASRELDASWRYLFWETCASLEEWRNSVFLHRRVNFTAGHLLRDEKASGEEMKKLSGSSSTVKGAFAGAGSAIQCLDLLRCFRAYTIPLLFRSLGKGMHEFLAWC